MKPFFSFIIPCCDVEPYVRECFASITGQSFTNWECLIGIEPSKDRTEEVIDELTAGDERFRIFHGPRSGSCSATRNTGARDAAAATRTTGSRSFTSITTPFGIRRSTRMSRIAG